MPLSPSSSPTSPSPPAAPSRLLRWVAVLGWAGVVWLLLTLSVERRGGAGRLDRLLERLVELAVPLHGDKLVHLLLFAVLAWLLVRALSPAALVGRWPRAAAFALAVLYGGATELAQAPIEGRDASWGDLAADAAGALAAAALVGRPRRGGPPPSGADRSGRVPPAVPRGLEPPRSTSVDPPTTRPSRSP